MLAAMLLKNLHVLLADFDRRFEAVGDKRRREHQHFFDPVFGTLCNDLIAERREPFFIQTALKRHAVTVFGDAQAFSQCPRCGVTGGLVAIFILLVDFRFAAVVGATAVLVNLVYLAGLLKSRSPYATERERKSRPTE